MKFYHATSTENMERIAETGIIKKSWDGVVYLCKDPIDACKFLVLRGLRKICVIETELNEEDVEESFEHSQAFSDAGHTCTRETSNSQEQKRSRSSHSIYKSKREAVARLRGMTAHTLRQVTGQEESKWR